MKTHNPNDYDQIKVMLKKIRVLKESKSNGYEIISEQIDSPNLMDNDDATKQQYDNIEVVNDIEIKLLSTNKVDTELKPNEKDTISQMIDSFRLEVSQISELDPGFVITEKQARLDGVSTEMDINFTFIAGEDMGLYVTNEMTLVNDEVIDFLTKLTKFYKTFITAMEPLIRERKLS